MRNAPQLETQFARHQRVAHGPVARHPASRRVGQFRRLVSQRQAQVPVGAQPALQEQQAWQGLPFPLPEQLPA
jgi:hypothetical protein